MLKYFSFNGLSVIFTWEIFPFFTFRCRLMTSIANSSCNSLLNIHTSWPHFRSTFDTFDGSLISSAEWMHAHRLQVMLLFGCTRNAVVWFPRCSTCCFNASHYNLCLCQLRLRSCDVHIEHLVQTHVANRSEHQVFERLSRFNNAFYDVATVPNNITSDYIIYFNITSGCFSLQCWNKGLSRLFWL